MASFTEDKLVVNIVLTRDPADGTDHVFLNAVSYDSVRGQQVRTSRNVDVTGLVPNRMPGITALLNDAIAYVQQQWQIPTLVQARESEAVPEPRRFAQLEPAPKAD